MRGVDDCNIIALHLSQISLQGGSSIENNCKCDESDNKMHKV